MSNHNPFVKKVLALFKKTHEEDKPKYPTGLSAKYVIEDKVLGVGSFAVVKECTERTTGTKYAVKIILKKVIAGKFFFCKWWCKSVISVNRVILGKQQMLDSELGKV